MDRRDALTTGTAAALLGAAALSGIPQPSAGQVPPPFGTAPKRKQNEGVFPKLRTYRPQATTFGAAVVEYASMAEGQGEQGGNNAGPFVDWITQTPPHVTPAWCAGFVCACWFFASYGLQRVAPWQTWRYGPDGGIDPELWVPTLAANAQRVGAFVSGYGDVATIARVVPGSVLFVRDPSVKWSHVGIVTAIDGSQIRTIEGNVGASTSATGLDMVKRLSRPVVSCDYGLAV